MDRFLVAKPVLKLCSQCFAKLRSQTLTLGSIINVSTRPFALCNFSKRVIQRRAFLSSTRCLDREIDLDLYLDINLVSARWRRNFMSTSSSMEGNVKKYGIRRVSSDGQNNHPPPKKMPFWQRLLFVSGVAGVIYYIFKDAIHKKEIESEQTRYQELGKAQLGGDWTLTDHHGKKRSSTEFRGQWILLYFGFTHCPDICPEELEKLIEIVKMFEKEPSQLNIQPLFISLDPERDSPKVIKEYCAEYSSRLLGFTGPEDDIREVCKKFRVYFGKGERDENNDYIVDHTIIIYLINPSGEFVNYFGRSLSADTVYKSVAQHIERYNELELAGKLGAKHTG